eukprot:5569455-Prymnesium_polylepis.2
MAAGTAVGAVGGRHHDAATTAHEGRDGTRCRRRACWSEALFVSWAQPSWASSGGAGGIRRDPSWRFADPWRGRRSTGTQAKGTQATLSLSQVAASSWAYDFCDRLIFPQIAGVRVHVVAASGFPTAVARPPDGCKVTVETAEPVTGTITVELDSSAPSDEF